MNPRRTCLLTTLLLLAGGFAAQAEEPAAFLARAKEAAGGAAWNEKRALHTVVAVTAASMSGEAEAWDDLATGRSTTRFTLGPVSGAMGFDGERSWSMDPAGETHTNDGREELETAANDAYLRSLAHFFPERWPASYEPLRSESEGGASYQVVAVTPKGGRRLELWFDTGSLLLTRIVDRGVTRLQVTTLSDYREVEGVKVAFSQRSSTGNKDFDQSTTVTRLEFPAAVESSRFEMPTSRAHDVTIAGGQTSVTLPLELVNNHLYITARFNGGEPRRVMVDTGGVNLLTQDAAAALGLASQGAVEARGSGEGTTKAGVTKVNTLQLGPIEIKDPIFFVFPIDYMKSVEGLDFAGLVGFEIFKRFVVTIDYAGRRLTLTRPEAFAYTGKARPLPFTFAERTPQIEARLDGATGLFTLDTGSRSSLTINGPFAAQHGLAAKYGAKTLALTGWGVGGGVKSLVARGKELSIGPPELAVPVPGLVVDLAQTTAGAFANPHLAGNIGGGVLKRFTVTFDYGKKLLYLEPNANFDKVDPFDQAGLWLNLVAEGFRIEDVVVGSPAAEAGLRLGDLVTGINGRPASSWRLSELRQFLRSRSEGTEVLLSIKRGEDSRQVLIKPRELI